MNFFSSCRQCNFIRVFLALALLIIIFLPFFARARNLIIPVSPMQISIAMMCIGVILFVFRAWKHLK